MNTNGYRYYVYISYFSCKILSLRNAVNVRDTQTRGTIERNSCVTYE